MEKIKTSYAVISKMYGTHPVPMECYILSENIDYLKGISEYNVVPTKRFSDINAKKIIATDLEDIKEYEIVKVDKLFNCFEEALKYSYEISDKEYKLFWESGRKRYSNVEMHIMKCKDSLFSQLLQYNKMIDDVIGEVNNTFYKDSDFEEPVKDEILNFIKFSLR